MRPVRAPGQDRLPFDPHEIVVHVLEGAVNADVDSRGSQPLDVVAPVVHLVFVGMNPHRDAIAVCPLDGHRQLVVRDGEDADQQIIWGCFLACSMAIRQSGIG